MTWILPKLIAALFGVAVALWVILRGLSRKKS